MQNPNYIKELGEQLEAIIDSLTLSETVVLFVEICQEKAEHIKENWQDENLAKTWSKAASRLEKTSREIRQLKI